MNTSGRQELHRTLGLGLLVFYGVGIIIGAGVYVVVGDVIAVAGSWAVWSFALAGVLAALTALCYAELGARYPEAAGAAAYAREAFGSDLLSRMMGLAVMAVILISAAAIARGVAGYAQVFIDLPGAIISGFVVIFFTAVSCLGVRDSVRMASVMTVIELAGLLLVIVLGFLTLPTVSQDMQATLPDRFDIWQKIAAGAFLAFFAFTGFENLANMAEETKDAGRTIPYAILISLGLSTGVYLSVVIVIEATTLPGQAASAAPLLSVFENKGGALAGGFSALAIIAVSNGVLIQILTLARLFYGMARRSLLPIVLAQVSVRKVPVRATLLAGVLVLGCTLALPFESLLRLSTTLTLAVFVVVSLSLWQIQRHKKMPDLPFRVPGIVPVLAVLGNIALIVMGVAY